eukprot:GHVU01056501.1.p1 GENE.GHVU01056501.1~~GHVU01056501.1.p1  ORF type:complete len:194 (+),score=36.48 GHVU01056501.1:240-821(+)
MTTDADKMKRIYYDILELKRTNKEEDEGHVVESAMILEECNNSSGGSTQGVGTSITVSNNVVEEVAVGGSVNIIQSNALGVHESTHAVHSGRLETSDEVGTVNTKIKAEDDENAEEDSNDKSKQLCVHEKDVDGRNGVPVIVSHQYASQISDPNEVKDDDSREAAEEPKSTVGGDDDAPKAEEFNNREELHEA